MGYQTLHSAYRLTFDLQWRYWSAMTRGYLHLLRVQVGDGFRSFGMPIVRRAGDGCMKIGAHVTLINSNRANPVGLNHPCILVSGLHAVLEIGNSTGLSGAVLYAENHIKIGDHVLIGANARIYDTDFHPTDWLERRVPAARSSSTRPVIIEDDAFIGSGAIILKGVTVGRGAIIGAGAVVTKTIPPFTIWAGNPAHLVAYAPGYANRNG
jgi:acetyltransferase-like isoleucine patch superfamily enzyme